MPLRPWNLAPQPIYSLAVYSRPDNKRSPQLLNLNICTYVSPISLRPKHYLIALYHGTRTRELVLENRQSPLILHLLSVQQGALIRVLGRQSGYKIDKAAYLKSKRQLTSWRGYPVLFHAAAYLLLEPIQILPLGTYSGDHDLLLAHVITAKTLLDPASVLTTRHLIESGKILAKRN